MRLIVAAAALAIVSLSPAVAIDVPSPTLPAPVPGRAPDLALSGDIKGEQSASEVRVPFAVPRGIDRIVVAFDHEGVQNHAQLELGVYDPVAFRGQSRMSKREFTISSTDATPSYHSGPIQAGRWQLSIGVAYARPGSSTHWRAKIWFLKEGQSASLVPPTAGRGPGWYRGDLHLHTGHSDASCTSQAGRRVPCPLFFTLQASADAGLDFAAITEHNVTTHFSQLREAQPYFDRMLLIPGRELTTYLGHFNIWGPTEELPIFVGSKGMMSFNAIADRVHALGGLVSINHPGRETGESCTGCGWTMPDVDWSKVDGVEVINDTWSNEDNDVATPGSGIAIWMNALQRNPRIAAVGGSDNHDAKEALTRHRGVGQPTTVVFASDLTQPALLAGIRSGRAFLDLYNVRGSHLDFTVSGGGRTASMGGQLAGAYAGDVAAEASLPGGGRAILYDGKTSIGEKPLSNDGRLRFSYHLAPGWHVLRMAVTDNKGRIALLSNAITIR